jgi:hypothetical protein
MRVALVFDRPYVDAHPCFREMAGHFAACGWQVDLFMTQSATHPLPRFESPDVRILPLVKSRAGLFSLLRHLAVPGRYRAVVATPQWPLYWAVRARPLGRYSVTCLSDEIYPCGEALTPVQKKWKAREAMAHRRADLTVSLSEARMQMAVSENRLRADHPFVVIPNAPSGRAGRVRSAYYRERFSIPADRGILVHSGTLNWKLAAQLALFAATWSEPWDVVFQGRFVGAHNEPVPGSRIHYEDRVFQAQQMREVTSSADIGLALYDRGDPLEQRNGETPGKLGLYLGCGLPVICGNVDSLRWVADQRCGVWVERVDQVPAAAARITANYESYSRRAAGVFDERFDYSPHFDRFMIRLAQVGA